MRRTVVFGHMVGMETKSIVRLCQHEAIGVLSGHIAAILVQMIEDAEGEL